MDSGARPPLRYLEGLNGLRFIAATVVLLSHAWMSLVKLSVIHAPSSTPAFDRGRAAVDFFFTLSGFLITYLLIQESASSGTVSLKRFYVRRVKRIWPLYYLVLAIGFTILGIVYPLVFHEPYFDFRVGSGLLLFVLFLPNLMAALHHVGMLNPLWSIGVEEQFYLFWAPMVKWFGRRMFALVLAFVALTLIAYAILSRSLATQSDAMEAFVRSLRFHYMAIGSVFSWILFNHRDRYERSLFASGWFQIATVVILLYHYAFELPGAGSLVRDVALACVYGTLILNVSVIPNRLINLEWQPLVHLGQISYGIYMYHMTIDYLLRTAAGRLPLTGPAIIVSCGYASVLLGVTIGVAHVSYTRFETYFTRQPVGEAKPAAVPEAQRIIGLAAP